MKKEVVLFQNLESARFKADRMRKTIKAALSEAGIGYSFDKLANEAKIAHFIPPFKYSSIERAIAFDKKIVISAFYTEGEKPSQISNYRHQQDLSKANIPQNYLKSFHKAHKILVPCQEYKDLMVKKGIPGEKILILNPGVNNKIYRYLPETDMELTRRYYSLAPDTKLLLFFGNPKDKELMKRVIALANLRKDCKLIFLATNPHTLESFWVRIRRSFVKLPTNLILTAFKDINVYRSLLKNCRALIYMNSILIDEIQLNEALASEIQVIGLDSVFSKAFLEKDVVIHRDNVKDLFIDICDYIDYKISGTISNASFYINEQDVQYIGEQLKEIYTNLLMEEQEDDRY